MTFLQFKALNPGIWPQIWFHICRAMFTWWASSRANPSSRGNPAGRKEPNSLQKQNKQKPVIFYYRFLQVCLERTASSLTRAGRKRMVRITSAIGPSRVSTRKWSVNENQRDHTALPSAHLGSPELFQVETSSENRFPDTLLPLLPLPLPLNILDVGDF